MATMPKVLMLPVSESFAAQIAAELVRKWIAEAPDAEARSEKAELPIGADLDGGTYAGLTIHDGKPMRLVLLPDDFEGTWDDALAWAMKKNGALPSRIDQLVLWANLRTSFEETWYWSSEQYAPDAGYAWCQYSGFGYQGGNRKSSQLRARAVRRLPL